MPNKTIYVKPSDIKKFASIQKSVGVGSFSELIRVAIHALEGSSVENRIVVTKPVLKP